MIGSQRKTISIYKELEKEGIAAEKFASIHAPVGIDIGAITPEEIAVAIVAELIAVRRQAIPTSPAKPSRIPRAALRPSRRKTHSPNPPRTRKFYLRTGHYRTDRRLRPLVSSTHKP